MIIVMGGGRGYGGIKGGGGLKRLMRADDGAQSSFMADSWRGSLSEDDGRGPYGYVVGGYDARGRG